MSGPALADRDDDSGSGGLKNYFTPGTKTKITSGQDSPNINQAQAEAYDGARARIAVSRFTDKTHHGWWNHQIGDGMADQLATALFNSNRYIVLERRQLDDVLVEQDLGASGRVKQTTAAPIGQIEGAELLITGAVTEFEGNAGGTQGRVGGSGWGGWGSGWGGIVGAVTGGVRKAHIAIDVRVIDTTTSRIVAATSVEGEATDFNMGGSLGHYYGGGALGGALSTWKNTPIEKALRICIQEAVDFIAAKTPPVYYRHGQTTTQSASLSAPAPVPTPSPTTAALTRPPTAAYPKGAVVRVKSGKLNMRSGPGTSWQVVSSLGQNDLLLVLEQNQDWVQVQTTTKVVGWVAAGLIYPDNAVTAADFAKIGAAAAPQPAVAPAAATQPEPTVMPATATTAAAPAKESASSAQAQDVKARLKKLKDLYDLELITEEEYNAKRAEIISQF
jgi:curli biogenesis system outer membrane secretion channel CsgG/uncharacterized protein YraI